MSRAAIEQIARAMFAVDKGHKPLKGERGCRDIVRWHMATGQNDIERNWKKLI